MKNIDILSIHNDIMNQFKIEHDGIDFLMNKIYILNQLNCVIQLPEHLRQSIENDKQHLREMIEEIQSNEKMNFYILQTIPILEEYRKELEKPIQVNFMGKIIPPNTKRRDELVESFLQIIGRQTIDNDEKIVSMCEFCHSTQLTQYEKNVICMQCYCEQEQHRFTFSYTDINRINITAKYTYDRRIHFRDCINQYQGKHRRGCFNIILGIILK